MIKMAWDTHAKLGCAAVNCYSGEVNVVCLYGPKVEKNEKEIYRVGELCKDCNNYESEGASSCGNDKLCAVSGKP
ncbi:hypothetical protein Y032_0067g59 [Ancylostoma ceylanicum]|uniref:SCP domain-containing protein n=1 Tax=Ancylostoma ceylanicum TaxID=53326 RepID=A0A016TZL3_9BILA|nr:hypothetical protein Y032_0067g59 [Ancylostoma ceylanicum]